ncbi:MAG: PseG/SpsG family protein [Fibrobacterota bacterium]
MNCIVFTEAGKRYGRGHLMRCTAIAQGLAEHRISSVFVVRGTQDTGLSDFSCYTEEWLNTEIIEKYAHTATMAVVDSYYTSAELCTFIYDHFKTVVFMDDYNRILYPGGYVVNGVVTADSISYPHNRNIRYLLGPRFQALRKTFWDMPQYEVRECISNILITFGGSDPRNATPHYLSEVAAAYPDAYKNVVIGSDFTHTQDISDAGDAKTHLVYSPTAKKMKELMTKSDLAVSAGGQTICELARIGVPTVGIETAPNQRHILQGWRRAGFLCTEKDLGHTSSLLRREKSRAGRGLIDGRGVKRIVSKLGEPL